ncbi:putative formate dehydrogenase (C-terminal), related to acid resistance with formate dehydrogenase/DMSO reductase, domains 1-3 and ADC-like domain [Agrobacterium tumefaciens str. Kerr 14]|uniref:Putative formate dehydrogenase (C-terminal), related to acid resistance with formate dehydrogenase/DMSO reductase, domains 1-3 and ADC-like domain n=1 Tax=Agrobacterium tumefaciens str. Kerr 14 TaxID=1183424 RepID=A0A1S7SEJ9_AGRTU|nr:putative formate dehydrogenase (C-terminal), related to acid resistance with formate dehydrogenase/DMSO reductase, domains 1-3 and ADC-like domain [Agrobacterium tumefaciens str. Kerr 14]
MSGSPSVSKVRTYTGPAGGWGSAKSVTEILAREHLPVRGANLLRHQNKPEGYMCVSCAWAKPAKAHPLEFCENGAKATAWEVTSRRADRVFFEAHTLTELESWRDHDLEEQGRLTHPMKWDAATDKYVPIPWEQAFAEIGQELRVLAPEQVDLYTSGRASLETSYMYQLFARMYGSNNMPDSSNMCHESSSVALPESIGASVGTAILSDFENTDCIFYIAQNVGTSSPRMLHDLQDAVDRGAKIVTFNMLRERGLERFVNPQSPIQMLTGNETMISSDYYQVRNGGDIAALFGVCKALIEADDALKASSVSQVSGEDDKPADPENAAMVAFAASVAAADKKHILDHDFIKEHTTGFEEFATAARRHQWAELESISGLTRVQMTEAAATYAKSNAVLTIYGMGLTQHLMGVQNVHMVVNLALLRGNIGKPGANICAVRGHSNVQGQRTVGITEKPGLAPLDKLAELYGFEPPRWTGRSTVETCEAIIDGSSRAFVSLGGNFLKAIPETEAVEAAWRKLRLTVQISTKLNRSHVLHGEVAFLLPCLGRIEVDQQASGPQSVSMESSIAYFHGSRGKTKPASPELLSEPAIVAGIAKATLGETRVPWDQWVGDYGTVRDAIEATYPETFKGFNKRLFQPGGFPRPLPARERKWVTSSGKANFITPDRLFPDLSTSGRTDVLHLATLRSNDQFNTTIYGYSDRFRGVEGTRKVVFMNREDIAVMGLTNGVSVDLTTAIEEETVRKVIGFRVVEYNIPKGSCGAYFPETNPLFPLEHHDAKSKTPSYKLLPILITLSSELPHD